MPSCSVLVWRVRGRREWIPGAPPPPQRRRTAHALVARRRGTTSLGRLAPTGQTGSVGRPVSKRWWNALRVVCWFFFHSPRTLFGVLSLRNPEIPVEPFAAVCCLLIEPGGNPASGASCSVCFSFAALPLSAADAPSSKLFDCRRTIAAREKLQLAKRSGKKSRLV